MADADVIPLGARGRPGRGGNRSRTPSSAARSLASSAKTTSRQKRPAPGQEADPQAPRPRPAKKSARSTPPTGKLAGSGARKSAGPGPENRQATTRPRSRPTSVTGPSEPPTVESPPAATPLAPPEQEVFVRRRGGRVGFDLAAAIGNAAREVFGENWESALAEFLAFLRRRVTGDYVVDEFGFDPDLTYRLSMATIRPLVEKWFRVEVQGIENIPADGGALLVANQGGGGGEGGWVCWCLF